MECADKRELRRLLRGRRSEIGAEVRAAAEKAAGRLLKRRIRRGARIGVYWPVGSEMRFDGFIKAARERGALLYLPYLELHSRRMWFTPYPESGRQKPLRQRGRAAIRVPQFGGKKIRAHRLNLLLVPLVGIDREGFRLGQAGGYYDATLSALEYRLRPETVGVGFACQLVGRLPREAHDIPLDGFVSEQGERVFRRFRRPD